MINQGWFDFQTTSKLDPSSRRVVQKLQTFETIHIKGTLIRDYVCAANGMLLGSGYQQRDGEIRSNS
jgi:hypothetical protein